VTLLTFRNALICVARKENRGFHRGFFMPSDLKAFAVKQSVSRLFLGDI